MVALVPRSYNKIILGCAYDLSALDRELGWSIITDISINRDTEYVKSAYSSWPKIKTGFDTITLTLLSNGTLEVDPLTKNLKWQRWPKTAPVLFFYGAICDEAKETVIWLVLQIEEMISGLTIWPL